MTRSRGRTARRSGSPWSWPVARAWRCGWGRCAASPPLRSGPHPRSEADVGRRIHDLCHRRTFTFARGEDLDRDDFAEPGVVDRLALAARSTASFPGAFEPSYAPIGPGGVDREHP